MFGSLQETLTVEAGTFFSYLHPEAKYIHTYVLVPSLCSALNRKREIGICESTLSFGSAVQGPVKQYAVWRN